MNRYPFWKYLIIIALVIPGIFYALPNLYGDDPGIQIRSNRDQQVDPNLIARVDGILKAANVTYKSIAQDQASGALFVRFNQAEDQIKAKELIRNDLGNDYTEALNLLPATPDWMQQLGAKPMNLGLDLRGGVHFLMQIDIEAAIKKKSESFVSDAKRALRDERIRYQTVELVGKNRLLVKLRDQAQMSDAINEIEDALPELQTSGADGDSDSVIFDLRIQAIADIKEFAVQQNMTTLRSRIDELGVAEPVVQRQGDDRIVVELPGVQDTARAKEILGKTATLEIKMVNEERDGRVRVAPPGSTFYEYRNGREVLLYNDLVYSGENIIDAQAGLDQENGSSIVSITLDGKGAAINSRITAENIGNRMAVIYKETQETNKTDSAGKLLLDENNQPITLIEEIEEVITSPVIQSQLGKRFQITGLDSSKEAQDLSLLLRAGAFAAPIRIIEERTVGPSLGKQNIAQGFRSVMIGLTIVFCFMLLYYRKFGIIANVALVLNLVFLVAVLSLLQATLTLPGVAGMVLTVGMAVDANVLIFERIREELKAKTQPQTAISKGYEQAFSTILDANITTLIAAVVLFIFGTGPIKGFATTLSIGIVTSMFTAIFLTRGIVNFCYGNKRLKSLSI